MRVVIRGCMVVTPEKGGVRAERGAIVVDGDRIALPWSLRYQLAFDAALACRNFKRPVAPVASRQPSHLLPSAAANFARLSARSHG